MPLKIGQVLYKRKDQPEEVNDAIEAYYDEYGHGNKYLAFYFEDEADVAAAETLSNYFRELGFENGDELIICNEWWLDKVEAPQDIPALQPGVVFNAAAWKEAARIIDEFDRPRHVKGW